MDPVHIADIAKNKTEIIRIEISEYRGKKLLNIRTWFKTEEEDFAPTKKGVALSVEYLPQLLEALQKAQEKLKD